MNEIYDKILSSSATLRESFVHNNYPELCNKILNHIDLDISFKEKFWYYYNGITEQVTCKYNKCDNPTKFGKSFNEGYRDHCGSKCANRRIHKYDQRHREKTINEIVENPNRLRESYVKKNAPSLHKKVLNHIDLNIPFKEKLWYYYHDITEEFTCKCGNSTTFNRNFKDGYKNYCSAKCAQTEYSTKEKRRQTNMKVYGVDNVAKDKLIQEKIERTNLERYGTKSSFQNKDVRKKWKENVKKKYGVDHIFQLEVVKDSIKKTNKERYGVEYYFNSKEYATKMEEYDMLSIYKELHKASHIEKYREMGYEFVSIEDSVILTLKDGEDTFVIHRDTLKGRIQGGIEVSTTKNPLYYTGQSESEKQIHEHILSLDIDKVLFSNRNILEGKELDIYIPSMNIAFEYNGIYWHSDKYKKKNHHFFKTEKCISKGVDLYHIWEDDWTNRKELAKYIINKIMNKLPTKEISDYSIKEIDEYIAEQFILDNDINKLIKSHFYFGYYKKEELLSVMSISLINDNTIVINNMCDIKECIIKDSFYNIIQYIIKQLDITNILYYKDLSLPIYNMKALGFDKVKNIKMGYWFLLNKNRYSICDFDLSIYEGNILFTKGFNTLNKIWNSGKELYKYITH